MEGVLVPLHILTTIKRACVLGVCCGMELVIENSLVSDDV